MAMKLVVGGLAVLLAAGTVQIAVEISAAANVGVTAKSGPFVFEDGDGDDTTTINVGDTVTWTFEAGAAHTVTSDTGAFDSGQQTGGTFQHTFTSAGTYGYYCELHGGPGGFAMAGTITVQAAATNTPQATNTVADDTNTPTRTRTATPEATSTGTVTAIPTSPPATATPVEGAPISATEVLGVGAVPIIAPTVGVGDGVARGDSSVEMLTFALAVCGGIMIAGAAVARWQR